MTENALEKVLRLSGAAPAVTEPAGPDLRTLVGAAQAELREALSTGDPMYAATLVLAAMEAIDGAAEQLYVELSFPAPANLIGLAVLSTADRKKPGAHTIPGSTDFPIPDKGHLQAALARYKQGALAGHSKEEVAGHIRSRAKALGVEVDLSYVQYGIPVLIELAKGNAAVMDIGACSSEHHPPMHGTHSHAHTHTNDSSHGTGWDGSHMMGMAAPRGTTPPPTNMMGVAHGSIIGTHSHPHTHVGDNMHGGRSDTAVGTQMDAHQRHMAHVAHMEHLHAEHVRHTEHMAHQASLRGGGTPAAPSGGAGGGGVATGAGQAPGTSTAAGRGTGWG